MKTIHFFFMLMRPKQWLKNLMLFFPIFLSGSLFRADVNMKSGLLAFIALSSVASALYVVNDICDASRDSLHPIKRARAIAAGHVSQCAAMFFAAALALLGILIAAFKISIVLPYICGYAVLTLAYSFFLKKLPIVDVFCIASGFLIRLLAGGAVFQVEITEWLFFSVFFLALFLSIGKRLGEIQILGTAAYGHRESLRTYPDGVLDAMLYVTASTVLVTYTLYSLAHYRLYYTVPLCAFGLFRYIFRIRSGLCGDPTESLLKDIPLLIVSVCWVIQVGWSIYG